MESTWAGIDWVVDVLTSTGIVLDKIIGHSIGELGYAYADDCLTAEQTILAAYFHGLTFIENETISTSTATIGLGEVELTSLCSHEVLTDRNNSWRSSITSSLPDSITKFDSQPQANDMFATEESYNKIAYHNSYSATTGLKLLACLKKIIPDSKPRSYKWLNISIPHNISGKPILQSYFHPNTIYTDNLLNLASFEEISYIIPNSAIVRTAYCKLLYRGPRMYGKPTGMTSGVRVVEITLSDEMFEWIAGYVIEGRNLVLGIGYLVLVWETLALMQEKLYKGLPVIFEDIRFHRATTIPKHRGIELLIMVQKGSGRFELTENGTIVVTGFVRTTSNPTKERITIDTLVLTEPDIYKEMRLRGYQYTGLFRGLKGATLTRTRVSIAWKKNWVAFMDNMLQIELLGTDTRGLYIPTSMQRLIIDPEMHLTQLQAMPDHDKALTVEVHKDLGVIVCGGIEIWGMKFTAIARKKAAIDPVIEDYKFVAHRDRAKVKLNVVTRIAIQVALENLSDVEIKTIELISDVEDQSPEHLTSPLIQKILDSLVTQMNMSIIAPIDKLPADAVPSTIQVYGPQDLAIPSGASLVITHGLFASKNRETLKQLRSAMKNSSFMLAMEPINAYADILTTIQNESLDIILEKRTDKKLVFLLRKRPKLSKMVTVIHINNHEFSWLATLQAALKRRTINRILLVSESDFESGLIGFMNCLRKETGDLIIQGLFIQDAQAPKFSLENPFYSKQLDLGLTLNILRPDKLWGSYRFFLMDSLPLRPAYHFRLSQLTRNDLNSLEWVEGEIRSNNRPENMIEVHYSSINFRDIMMSTGKLSVENYGRIRQSQENIMGIEYSGKDMNGRAVMGIIRGGAFSNLCVHDNEFLWPVPNGWTLEDAATIPVVYCTAYYALMIHGRMKKGEKILIHAGSGGVGQAAITLALHEGCEVFTTVGTQQKRQSIRNQFPQIDVDHIGNSRDTSFEQLIFRHTKGKGVDIVLNSLAEDKLQASLRSLNKGGRFLEIGKFDPAANNLFGMEIFLKGISFYEVFLENLFSNSFDTKKKLAAMLAEGLKSGVVKSIIRTVFTMNQISTAFKYMAAGKHIGKVILRIRNENNVSQLSHPHVIPRYYCLENGSYLILGGLGGFGLELADWLVLRGARKLVLVSRKGIVTGYQQLRINIWRSYGVRVVIIVEKDASTREGCEAILKETVVFGPVDAIFNVAVVLNDNLWENQTVVLFEDSFRPKAWATKQLDELSRSLCPHLRHFVVFSSLSCGKGHIGQTNYGMSNSVMERICEKRVAENLPGLAIQWGAIGDVGLLAETQEKYGDLVVAGSLQQNISSCLQKLDGFLQQNSPVVGSMIVPEQTVKAPDVTNIIDAVRNIMGLRNIKTISLLTSLTELGMDSMMAIEIKQTLEREFKVFLTTEDIRGLSFDELNKISLEKALGKESHGKEKTN